MMLPIDCCIFDLDGTLLRSDKTVSKRTKAALQQLRDSGRTIALATSRNDIFVKGLALALGVTAPIISCNGALIRRLDDKTEIYSQPLPRQSAVAVAHYCLQHKKPFTISVRGAMLLSADSKKTRMFRDYNKTVPSDCQVPLHTVAAPDDLPDETILKIYIESLSAQQQGSLVAHLEATGHLPQLSFVRSGEGVDVSAHGVSKGAALHVFAKHFGIQPARIAAFGDDRNDISMLRAAAYSFAMGQAPEEVRRCATYTTADNDEDGVALAIETYLLSAKHCMAEVKTALKLSARDNTAVLLCPAQAGEAVDIRLQNRNIGRITARSAIDRYHKIAVQDISTGAAIYKYGEPVGLAGVEIKTGEHVHIHNMNSVVMNECT